MAAIDLNGKSLHTAPAVNAVPVTLNDGVDFTMDTLAGGIENPRAFICGQAGTLSIMNANGTIVGIPVLAGIVYPIVAKRFRTTGTSGVTTVVALG